MSKQNFQLTLETSLKPGTTSKGSKSSVTATATVQPAESKSNSLKPHKLAPIQVVVNYKPYWFRKRLPSDPGKIPLILQRLLESHGVRTVTHTGGSLVDPGAALTLYIVITDTIDNTVLRYLGNTAQATAFSIRASCASLGYNTPIASATTKQAFYEAAKLGTAPVEMRIPAGAVQFLTTDSPNSYLDAVAKGIADTFHNGTLGR